MVAVDVEGSGHGNVVEKLSHGAPKLLVLHADAAGAAAKSRIGLGEIGQETFGSIGVGLFFRHRLLQESESLEQVAMPPEVGHSRATGRVAQSSQSPSPRSSE